MGGRRPPFAVATGEGEEGALAPTVRQGRRPFASTPVLEGRGGGGVGAIPIAPLKQEATVLGCSKILSLLVSYFTSVYVMKWKEFFPSLDLKGAPYFDGRVVCYPRAKIILDYLAWRQVDCHINNQYNTCFWMLVKYGKTEKEAQEFLKGTQSKDKNELLFQKFNINYNDLPKMFRKGSFVYRTKDEERVKSENDENYVTRVRSRVVVEHEDIIRGEFWNDHPYILKEE